VVFIILLYYFGIKCQEGSGGEKVVKKIYYCGLCEPRPEERMGEMVIKRNHDARVVNDLTHVLPHLIM